MVDVTLLMQPCSRGQNFAPEQPLTGQTRTLGEPTHRTGGAVRA
jgi:hypothetical protein